MAQNVIDTGVSFNDKKEFFTDEKESYNLIVIIKDQAELLAIL